MFSKSYHCSNYFLLRAYFLVSNQELFFLKFALYEILEETLYFGSSFPIIVDQFLILWIFSSEGKLREIVDFEAWVEPNQLSMLDFSIDLYNPLMLLAMIRAFAELKLKFWLTFLASLSLWSIRKS